MDKMEPGSVAGLVRDFDTGKYVSLEDMHQYEDLCM